MKDKKRKENLNVSDIEKKNLIQIIENLYINWKIKTLDTYMMKNEDKIKNIINKP